MSGPAGGPGAGDGGAGARRPGLAADTASMLAGQGGRALVQAGYVLVLARELGPDGFGALSAVLALVALAMPFTSLGAVHLMVRAVVREPAGAPGQLASATVVTAVGGAVGTVVVTALGAAVLGGQVLGAQVLGAGPGTGGATAGTGTATLTLLATIAALAAADLVGALLAELCGGLYSATGRMRRTASIQLAYSGLRLAGALALLVAPAAFTLGAWAAVYATLSLTGAAVLVVAVRRDVGPARAVPSTYLHQWRDGLAFSIGLGSQAVHNDVDKAMLARITGAGAAGVYTAAYRLVDMAFVPVRALLSAAYPRFFAAGERGIAGTLALARSMAPVSLGYAVLAGAGLLLGAPLAPLLLGADYADVVPVLRGLALLPLLKVAHYLAADALTGAGLQGGRSAWQLGVAALAVVLNLALIPTYGVTGAVVSSLACDAALTVALWGLVARRLRAQRRRSR